MKQWYEENPKLLEEEKEAMTKFFPNFKLEKLDDGRLFWYSELCPGIYETKFGVKKNYTVMATYNNNHPKQVMGPSVRIYPILPDVDELFQEIGFRFNVLMDSCGCKYLCSLEGDLPLRQVAQSACYYLACAMKIFCGIDLLLTGDLTKEEIEGKYWFYGR